MEIQEANKSDDKIRDRKRLRLALIGSGGVLAILALAALWYVQHTQSSRPVRRVSASSRNASSTPATDAFNAAGGTSADPEIDLTAADLKKARIRTARVTERALETVLRVPGVVRLNEYRVVHVTPVADGIVKDVPVILGEHVRSGQPLAVVFSSELAEAETQYLSNVAELNAEHTKLQRTQKLVKLGAASQQEEEEVNATHVAHESHVRAALERLKLLGAGEQQVAALMEGGQTESNITVRAPIDGLVTARVANVGLVVTKASELFTVADLSRVWAMGSLNEKDFAAVHEGTTARITTPAYAGRVWNGRVAYIDPQVDPTTRTAQARIEVANPGESLRIQMYVDIAFASHGAIGTTVPETAVQSIGDRQFVFLPIKDNEGSFSMHPVRLGRGDNGYYVVLGGLKRNDKVVTDGSFILKAEGVRQHPELQ